MTIPEPVRQVVAYLEHLGLSEVRTDESNSFGSRATTYRGRIGVRILSDRGQWFIEVSDPQQPDDWYDMALLRELLLDHGPDVLDLSEQAAVLISRWDAIQHLFQSGSAAESHRVLQRAREERAKRRFSNWYK